MASSKKPPLIFYQKLGELFYAVAAADKLVHEDEYQALKDIVVLEWEKLEKENPSDAIYQMEVVFNWFDYEQLDAQSCFESFEEYRKENPQHFNQERKQLIWNTANAIANSYAGKNKSELIMLAKLQILLKD